MIRMGLMILVPRIFGACLKLGIKTKLFQLQKKVDKFKIKIEWKQVLKCWMFFWICKALIKVENLRKTKLKTLKWYEWWNSSYQITIISLSIWLIIFPIFYMVIVVNHMLHYQIIFIFNNGFFVLNTNYKPLEKYFELSCFEKNLFGT